jgi:peptidoglycan-associated lipoprotein
LAELEKNPGAVIRIEGNCDERGTVEYNLALGEKRAKAALDYLVKMGIDPSRISTVSYGKERPMDPGHTEAAWAKNRRDDFVIVKQ